MKHFYFAAFIPVKDGGYEFFFPETSLPFAYVASWRDAMRTAEATLASGLQDASDELDETDTIDDLQDLSRQITSLAAIQRETVQYLSSLGFQAAGEILYLLVPAPSALEPEEEE